MTPIIYVATERDGAGYHPASKDGFSVFLAIDVATEEGENAEAAFRALLAALHGVRLAFYAFADSAATAPLARVDPELVPAAADGDVDGLSTWLKQRQTDGTFWEHLVTDQGEATSLRAGQILRSAHQWPGPLPHRHRLTVVARVEAGTLHEGTWRLLPFFDEPPTADALSIEVLPDDTITYEALGSLGRVIAVANVVERAEDVPLVDEATGFVEGLALSAGTLALLEKLQQRGATLFWPTPYLSHEVVQKAFKEEPANDQSQTLGALRALTSTVSAFDPVFLSLLMPGVGTASAPAEGPILDLLLDALDENTVMVDRADAVQRIRTALLTLPLFPDPATSREAETYRTVLVTLAGLKADSYDNLRTLISQAILRGGEPCGDLGELDRELGTLVTDLNAEAGAERAIIAVFEALVIAQRVRDAVAAAPDAEVAQVAREQAARPVTSVDVAVALAWALDLDADVVGDLAAAFETFRSTLLGSFNGAEAVRQAAGAVLVDAVGREPNDLVDHLRRTNYMAMRFAPADLVAADDADLPLAKVAASLPRALLKLEEPQIAAIEMVFLASLADALRIEPDTRRFEPDPAPQALPVPLTASSNPAELAVLSQRYNGLALLIRVETERVAQTNWACANLARITPRYGNEFDEAVVLPLTPLLVDGQSRMFTRYDGLPFASSAFASTRPTDQLAGGSVRVQDGTEAPSYFDIEAWADSPHAPLPPIVYGARYQCAVFAVAGGGSLPRLVCAADNQPWKLGTPETIDVPEEAISQTEYSRRTAIGRVGFVEGDNPRIGREIEHVQPLAADYPRFAVTPAAHVDVLRQPNGRGAIAFQATGTDTTPEVLTVRFNDVRAAVGGTITIAVYDAPNPALRIASRKEPADTNRPPLTIVTLTPLEGATITLRFVRQGGEDDRVVVEIGDIGDERVLATATPDAPTTYWLRLGADEPVSLTLPDLDFTPEGRDQSEAQPPILLVADSDQRWRKEVCGGAAVQVHAPRVGFQDFQRWLLNGGLRDLHKGAADRASPSAILDAAEVAYAVRHAGTPKGEPAIGMMLDSLPDPAVAGLFIELTRLDGLKNQITETAKLLVPLPRLGDAILSSALPDQISVGDEVGEVAQRHRAFLAALRNPYALPLTVHEGTFALTSPNGGHIVVSVPAGSVALLAIRPLVPAAYFETPAQGAAAIDPDMLQLACGEAILNDGQQEIPCVLFEGERVLVEAMTVEMGAFDGRTLADHFVEVMPAQRSRRYQLRSRGRVGDAELEQAWRHIYRVDVHTQRWTFGGRPIYSWFAPQTTEDRSLAPALPIAESATVTAFEDEIFLGRSDEDKIVRTVNLDPLPGATVLETQSWEWSSATWYRHRYGLRSRYEGAFRRLAEGTGYLTSWSHAAVWHTRVAMLAHRANGSLARPQLRAYLPLTVSPDADAAPPVVAILQEPPLAAGGLADRMSAEIATALDYHFVPDLESDIGNTDPAGTMQLETARREAGRDPRLTYLALPGGRPKSPPARDLARGLTLVGEGPVGLTFDNNASVGAAWANSLWSFAPLGLVEEHLPGEGQEFFMRAFLQRRLAPEWVFDPAPPPLNADGRMPQDDVFWLDFELTDQLPAAGLFIGASDGPVVLSVTRNGEYIVAQTERRRLDVAASDGSVTIATVKAEQTSGLSVMLQPLSVGKGVISIYTRPTNPSNPGRGRSNAPLLLASFHWSAPQDGNLPLVQVGARGLWRTAASQPTEGEWVRTGRDFDRLYGVVNRDGAETTGEVEAVGEVTPILNADGTLTFRDADSRLLWLRSREQAKMPVGYVHRQLFVLVSRPSRGLGRKVMVFHTAVRAEARVIRLDPLPPANSRVSVVEVEIPARPLAFFPDGSPAKKMVKLDFGAIDIDLKAVAARSVDGVLVSLRFLPSWDDLRTMIFDLERELRGDELCRDELKLSFDHTDGAALVGCDIVFERTVDNKTVVTAEAIDRDGLSHPVEVTRNEALALSFEPISLQSLILCAVALKRWDGQAPGEFWCDVSVRTLYCKVTPDGTRQDGLELSAFPFEWLFSDEPSAARAEQVIGQADLAQLKEVQARIVSVSDAMVIDTQ